ncbi:TonB-dependent receptor [Polynucleobacter sphagniphilus]|uniref:TonB-dependent receptor n=1 Tax=Polynucleobacter sphagniphilus TaxID=1743169 RepID=UPI00096B7810|nr:TonB-dependent receptor [Polynucleobacter sphagniphilus]MBT8524924.1 TonB-dependent receptor [Polynucleobacter paneuropaeus]MDH6240747.1 iron complex outermembrane receptor protein [Polynucleobacter sphagniphilus]MDH6301001.1 iron complex outermembrane receptor protein [Polynucleobacter sphagniphilus]OLY97480.1 TonB-dependent receptor [Polynucleobacter sphagniphilus]QWC97812.1 TonB-dependent receptor [Polynucleobacter paneuropaeus]
MKFRIPYQLALLSALGVSLPYSARAEDPNGGLVIESNAISENNLMSPSKVLSGDELQNKLGNNLGATLSNELGVSATGFGAGASRPVIRGLEGARVQILENGLSVSDVSSISADHATANPLQSTRQIEILRGASALMYGSGSSGGLVNVINDRIATSLPGEPTGSVNTSYETVNQDKTASAVVDTSTGPIAFHIDTAISNANNYQIPGYAEQGGPNANWAISPGVPQNVPYSSKLPFSFNNENNLGLGASYIGDHGYTGVSLLRLNHDYGVPTADGGFINQSQNRYDLQHETRDPMDGFSAFKFSISNSHYMHNEFDNNGVPQTNWVNDATELRAVLDHQSWMGWKGSVGLQSSTAKLTATDIASGNADIVPQTVTNSNALFWVEQGNFGDFKNSLGLRYNYVTQNPNQASVYADSISTYSPPSLINRQFNLGSYSLGTIYEVTKGYGLAAAYTVSQRAPSAPELYAFGPHDATATYIVGNSNLQIETSHNIELGIQKTSGLIQGKANIYQNQFSNYIYGFYTGNTASGDGYTNYPVVVSQQANATIKGVEGELTYNWQQNGVGTRLFGDASQGTFNSGGNLPLQPAPRLGAEIAQQVNQWKMNATYIHAFEQTRLASFEIGPTPSYNLLNAGVSYTERINSISWTGYLRLTNLLNQDIRYATTPETVRLYAPQPGRSAMIGVRAAF